VSIRALNVIEFCRSVVADRGVILTACVAGLLCGACSRAAADVLEIVASRDNTLYHDPSGAISNGAGPYVYAGRTLRNSSLYRRTLLGFDVSAIPDGAQITDVRLRLTMSQTIAGDVVVGVHRVQADWGEGASNAGDPGGGGTAAEAGDATWLHAFSPGVQWTTPGGDFDAAPLTSTVIGASGAYEWPSTGSLIALVESWRDAPGQNFGVLLLGDEAQSGSTKRFASREHPESADRPRLIITFENCPADFNGDGFLDFTDFDDFVGAFEAGAASADFNGDGFLDFTDFDEFVGAFEAGC